MKCVILAGGKGTRLREETAYIPKPMVLIGNKPMIWHIMKIYEHYGITEFIICLGYKGELIREYFTNYAKNNSDCTVYTNSSSITLYDPVKENWKVTLVDTGLNTQTGGRIKRIQKYLHGDTFMATYGDGLANINLDSLFYTHTNKGLDATLTGVFSKSRFGELEALPGGRVLSLKEKSNSSLINGGFFIFNSSIFQYIYGDDDPLEAGLLSRLAEARKLNMFEHDGFWQCMDTYKETEMLNTLWNADQAPWKIWEN